MSVRTASAPKEVQEFQFKKSSKHEITEKLAVPVNCSLVAADGKRGLLYIGHHKVITVLKLGNEGNIEWRTDLNLPDNITRLSLNCDSTLVAVNLSGPSVLIYSAAFLSKNVLDLLHEIRLSSSSGDISVCDLRWNPAVPGMLCTVTSDHTIGSFQVSSDKKSGFVITGSGRIEGVEALCAAWSPKGKQVVVGCRNGNIIQLKPELKIARAIPGPNPNMGSVIAILWVSNFQFCASYQHPVDGRVNVLIVDAPKGETVAIFTNYEDITYGGIPTNQFYFDYIPEWGVIIGASSSSSEIAVLGTADNGISWEQWQLIDNSRAELPLVRTDESFPVGLAIDRSPTTPLALNPENVLPNPVPILHILATSGQLCSFHIVNLKPNCPAICVPPSEIVVAPPAPVSLPASRPSIGSSEISFNLSTGVTSTPRAKMEPPKEKPKNILTPNFFADSAKLTGFAPKIEPEKSQVNLPATNLLPMNPPPVNLPPANQPSAPLPKIDTKMNTFIQQTEPKIPEFAPPVELNIPKPKIDKIEKQPKPEIKLQKETPSKDPVPEKSKIDDSLCLRAYREEQVNFEKELKTKLEPLIWEVGTKAEKEQIIEKTALIDEFLRDLQETTSSLASDIAYLRGFLIQSFAWLEETNSKNSESVKLSSRNRRENSKLTELQELLYYTQSQLVQASKVLDLQWSEQQSREQKKIKIPNMECIYQSLLRHGQIVAKEKSNLEGLIKKWKSIARGNSISDLNRSISNLQITSMNSSHFSNDSAIDLRCRAIANMNLNFSREKQMKLRDFLSESAPRIIKPAKPTLIQDRLASTLSSLASASPIKDSKPKPEQKSTPKPKVQSPLASLNTIVSKIGIPSEKPIDLNLQQKIAISPGLPAKTVPALVPTLQKTPPKQTINISFAQNSTTPQNLVKPFPKVDAISFGQKSEEKTLTKDGKSGIDKDSTLLGKNSETINFSSPGNSVLLTPTIQSTFSLQSSVPANAAPPSTAAQNFSFASKPANSPAFSFASKPEEKANLDLGGLNLSQSGITITPIGSISQPTPAMSSINFGKASTPSNIFGASGTSTFGTPSGNTFGTSTASSFATPASSAPATVAVNTFGTSGTTTSGTSTFGTPTSIFGTGSALGASGTAATSGAPAPTSPTANTFGTSAGSIFGTNTFSNFGSSFGKGGSIFGGNSGVSSASEVPGLSAITVSGTSALATPTTTSVTSSTPLNSSVSSTNSTSVISSVSTSPPPGASTNTSSSGLPANSVSSSVIVSKPISMSSPILASSLASPGATSSPSSVAVSAPPPSYASPSVSVASSAGSGLDMFSLSLSPSKTTATTTTMAFPTPTTSIFSTPAFGANSSAASTLNFGTASSISSSNMITPAFGKEQTATPGSIFGGSTASSGSVFGKSPSTPNANPFGGNALAQSPSSTSVFGNAANSPGNSIFGGASTTSTAFGMKAPTSSASVFGMPAQPSAFGGGADNTSLFGGAAAAKPQETNFSMFGGSSATGGGSSVFGQAPAFGTKPAFGANPVFEQPKSVFGSGFGAAPSFGASPVSAGFGSPPMMGGSPPALGGNQMQKVFGGATGSNTFESLANQSGGLSFSSLAQSSPVQQQQQQQHQQQQEQQKPPDFAAKSSFSSWR